MMQETHILFPPFHFDLVTERLWRGAEAIALRPKTLAVLRHLVERPGQLVTPQELLRAVWSGVYVGQSMPRLCIREIRAALGDDAKRPQFIETHPRRGYRWIAPLTTSSRPVARRASRVAWQLADVKNLFPTPYPLPPAPYLVGREAELAQLHGWFEKARSGERQIVFVTGEPGIGKTTLVEAFFQSLESSW
jgi:DNA-binding winged helix-turn-helix (wHTH) protein